MAANLDGAMTPRPQSRTALSPLPETAAIRELLAAMKGTLSTLGQTFDTLNDQSAKVSSLGPTMVDTTQQIQLIRRQIRSQDKKQEARIKEVKRMVRDQLKNEITERMKPQIKEQIEAEITLQVAKQVTVQIKDHLPVSLEDQVADNKTQFEVVKHSLINSEARRLNSSLRSPRDLAEPLTVVLKANGQKSSFFPADLTTLFSYDLNMAKALVKDYGLLESEIRETNLNRFMSHIGIQFSLIAIPGRLSV